MSTAPVPPVHSFIVKEFKPGQGSAEVANTLIELSPMVTIPAPSRARSFARRSIENLPAAAEMILE